MTINFDTITYNYEVIYVIKTVMKYYLKKIDASFHQRLPNIFFSFIYFSIVRILQSPVHYHLTRVYRGIKKKSVKK